MRIAIPPITEPEAELKQRLQREHDSHKKLRLQMLSLLASGQAHDRQGVARTHGVQIQDKTLYTLVRTRFRTKLKVPRPSHTKKP
jgi:hypothetical protein